jgi:hypothetical protein
MRRLTELFAVVQFGALWRASRCHPLRYLFARFSRATYSAIRNFAHDTLSAYIFVSLNPGPRTIAAEAARRGTVKAHAAIALRDDDPTAFELEQTKLGFSANAPLLIDKIANAAIITHLSVLCYRTDRSRREGKGLARWL